MQIVKMRHHAEAAIRLNGSWLDDISTSSTTIAGVEVALACLEVGDALMASDVMLPSATIMHDMMPSLCSLPGIVMNGISHAAAAAFEMLAGT